MYGLKPVPFTVEKSWAAGWDEGQLQSHMEPCSSQSHEKSNCAYLPGRQKRGTGAPGCDEEQLQILIRLRSGQAFDDRRGGLLWMTSVFA